MIFTKFHKYQLINDREINEKHALLVECGSGYLIQIFTHLKLCPATATVHKFKLLIFQFQFETKKIANVDFEIHILFPIELIWSAKKID